MSKLRVVYTLDFACTPRYISVRDVQEAVTVASAIKDTVKLVAEKAELIQKTTIINLEYFNEQTNDWEFWFDEKSHDFTEYFDVSN